MAENGELGCRVLTFVKGQNYEWLEGGVLPAGGEFQQTIGVKFYADGALGSRGAALLEPYSDSSDSNGLLLLSHEELFERCVKAVEQGFNIATHAIGDAANRLVIDVYEQLRKEKYANENALLRIEHTQILHPDDIERLNKNNIIASVQSSHCISDAPMAEKRLGKRCAYSYPWKSLLQNNIHICGGSDFPIESHNPLIGIDAFCRRIPFHSSSPWFANERITREQAIKAYTTNAHLAGDVSYRRGRIETGYDADFVILDKNVLTCSDKEILSVKIVATYSGGVLRYEQ